MRTRWNISRTLNCRKL